MLFITELWGCVYHLLSPLKLYFITLTLHLLYKLYQTVLLQYQFEMSLARMKHLVEAKTQA